MDIVENNREDSNATKNNYTTRKTSCSELEE